MLRGYTVSVPSCPFCAEPIKTAAIKCPWCQSDLGGSAPAASPLADRLREWQKGPEETPPPRRRLGFGFWISAVLVAAVVALPAFATKRTEDIGGVVCLMLAFFGWIPLIFLCLDLTRIYPETCATPERALKGFAQAVRRKNWKLAREFVAAPDLETTEPRWTPEQVKATPPRASFSFAGDGFVRYWKYLVSRPDTRPRWARASAVSCRTLGPALAEGELKIDVGSYSILAFLFLGLIGYLVTLTHAHFRFRKLLVQKGRRWYLANGECDDRGDARLRDALAR